MVNTATCVSEASAADSVNAAIITAAKLITRAGQTAADPTVQTAPIATITTVIIIAVAVGVVARNAAAIEIAAIGNTSANVRYPKITFMNAAHANNCVVLDLQFD